MLLWLLSLEHRVRPASSRSTPHRLRPVRTFARLTTQSSAMEPHINNLKRLKDEYWSSLHRYDRTSMIHHAYLALMDGCVKKSTIFVALHRRSCTTFAVAAGGCNRSLGPSWPAPRVVDSRNGGWQAAPAATRAPQEFQSSVAGRLTQSTTCHGAQTDLALARITLDVGCV